MSETRVLADAGNNLKHPGKCRRILIHIVKGINLIYAKSGVFINAFLSIKSFAFFILLIGNNRYKAVFHKKFRSIRIGFSADIVILKFDLVLIFIAGLYSGNKEFRIPLSYTSDRVFRPRS